MRLGVYIPQQRPREDVCVCVCVFVSQVLRVFHDRLVDDHDRTWLCGLVLEKIETHFRRKPKQVGASQPCVRSQYAMLALCCHLTC